MSDYVAGMSESPKAPVPLLVERRSEPREAALADLWMVTPQDATVLRCRCVDRSGSGMRLRVPLGYGVHEGQRYELCSHPPGSQTAPALGLRVCRDATVMWTKIVLHGDEHHLDVGVRLESEEQVFTGAADFPSA
jgi:hypothetical protein